MADRENGKQGDKDLLDEEDDPRSEEYMEKMRVLQRKINNAEIDRFEAIDTVIKLHNEYLDLFPGDKEWS